jgi:hypothetical protein
MLLLFSFAFVCSGRGGATGDEDDGDWDVMLLAEQTLLMFLLIFTCSSRSVFLVFSVGFITLVSCFVSLCLCLSCLYWEEKVDIACCYGWCMLTVHSGGCWMLMELELEEAHSASPQRGSLLLGSRSVGCWFVRCLQWVQSCREWLV